MSGAEAKTIRERLGLTIESLAADLGLTPHVVASWENGGTSVSTRIAKELRWREGLVDRHEALAASGLPECPWVASWDNEQVPDTLKAQTAHLERYAQHQTSCATCVARHQFIQERFPPLPPRPTPGWVGAMAWLNERIAVLPRWGQPAAWAALAFGAYGVVKILFMLPSLSGDSRLWLVALNGLAASVALGASLGLAYGGFRAYRERRVMGPPSA
jgi:transcriptional regulator with XRE-family HTH domain